jgi:hypothetical protein
MACGLLDHVQDHVAHGDDVVGDADVDHRAGRRPGVERGRGEDLVGADGLAAVVRQCLGGTATGPESGARRPAVVLGVGRLVVLVDGSLTGDDVLDQTRSASPRCSIMPARVQPLGTTVALN